MKKYFILISSAIIFSSAMAQEVTEPEILPDYYAQKINPVGKDIMAQDIAGNAIVFNLESGAEHWFGGYYPGNGNCLANNGLLVGQEMEYSRAAIMKNGSAGVPTSFVSFPSSCLEAVTPDAKRACGWVQNTKGGAINIPVYCDLDENGNAGKVNYLPYPAKDFFGDTPQFCTAAYISDDGKTIAGSVQDGTGFYSYPIIYKEDENGEWSYTCPSEPMFNPDHLPVPHFPDLDSPDMPRQPQITDFMSPEMKEEWEADMADYLATNDPNLNPWSYVTYFTGEEGYKQFEMAVTEYYLEVNEILGNLIDNYWKEMAKIGKNASFIPNLVLSPKGDILIADLATMSDEYTSDNYSGFQTYKFNLADDSYSIIDSQVKDVIPTQMLNDGTLITVSSPSSELPYTAYILLPDASDYVSFDQYVREKAPSYVSWLDENLDFLGTGVISGIVSMSEDKSVMVGGVPVGSMLSYIISTENASVKSIEDFINDTYNVFNLNGIKILSTKDKSELSNLPEGIYIINGKKIKL